MVTLGNPNFDLNIDTRGGVGGNGGCNFLYNHY